LHGISPISQGAARSAGNLRRERGRAQAAPAASIRRDRARRAPAGIACSCRPSDPAIDPETGPLFVDGATLPEACRLRPAVFPERI